MGPGMDEAPDNGTILLIEDEEVVQEVCCVLLQRLGYHTIVARTGSDAVDLARSHDGDIDLVLLDIVLPDMAAKDIYTQILAARPYLKVLICSGGAIDGPAQEILDKGAEGFLQKPFTLSTLSARLDEILIGRKIA
ncbi:MAG: response regulator [Desulfobacterales bacterium]